MVGVIFGKIGGNTQARHTFKLVDLNYVYLPDKNMDFINSLPDYMVLYNYTNHFIMSSGYTYSFSNYSPQNRLRNTHSLRASVEVAGEFVECLFASYGGEEK